MTGEELRMDLVLRLRERRSQVQRRLGVPGLDRDDALTANGPESIIEGMQLPC